MDDQQTYLLNGLVTRQFGLGRILRFREVARGRQAATYEILTAQQNEYLLLLIPPMFNRESLEFVAGAVNRIDAERFSVVPFVKRKDAGFVGEGTQGSHLMVSLSPVGNALTPAQYSIHDVSQVGLRLAWMHRLLGEQVGEAPIPHPLPEAVARLWKDPTPEQARWLPSLPDMARQELLQLLMENVPTAGGGERTGWVHGDIQPACLLHDGDHLLRTVVDWGLLHAGYVLEDIVDAYVSLCEEPVEGAGSSEGSGVGPGVRGRALLEGYDSLSPLKNTNWVAVVANWCGQRLVDAAAGRRSLPKRFASTVSTLTAKNSLAAQLRHCL